MIDANCVLRAACCVLQTDCKLQTGKNKSTALQQLPILKSRITRPTLAAPDPTRQHPPASSMSHLESSSISHFPANVPSASVSAPMTI